MSRGSKQDQTSLKSHLIMSRWLQWLQRSSSWYPISSMIIIFVGKNRIISASWWWSGRPWHKFIHLLFLWKRTVPSTITMTIVNIPEIRRIENENSILTNGLEEWSHLKNHHIFCIIIMSLSIFSILCKGRLQHTSFIKMRSIYPIVQCTRIRIIMVILFKLEKSYIFPQPTSSSLPITVHY